MKRFSLYISSATLRTGCFVGNEATIKSASILGGDLVALDAYLVGRRPNMPGAVLCVAHAAVSSKKVPTADDMKNE